MTLLLLAALLIVACLVHQFWYRRLGLPNGPTPLPGIGNIHMLWNYERWEDKFLEWKNKYGNIYTYWIGPVPVVSVNDYKTAVDMFVKDGETYNEKEYFEKFFKATRGGLWGLIDTWGPLWREQRRFTLHVLRDFGFGKNKMQDRILEEVQTICDNVDRDIKAGVVEHDFHKHTDIATGSVINAIVCGYRFSADERRKKEFYKLKELTERMLKNFSDPLTGIAIVSDFLSTIPPFSSRFKKTVDMFEELAIHLYGVIDDHINNNDYSSDIEPQDYIDAYLIEMYRAEQRGEPHYFSKIQLVNCVFDLWFAGFSRPGNNFVYDDPYLIRYPQKQLHEELDRVIGSDRMITVADKPNLPYTQAVVLEIQRSSNIIVQNLLHKTTRDVTVDGVKIKKGAIVIPQLSVIMMDQNVFEDPKEFNPSRFIDSDGRFKPRDEVLSFGLGKRVCLGENLARMELFLFIANIFNQYRLLPGEIPPTLKRLTGVSMSTIPYKCRVEKRY